MNWRSTGLRHPPAHVVDDTLDGPQSRREHGQEPGKLGADVGSAGPPPAIDMTPRSWARFVPLGFEFRPETVSSRVVSEPVPPMFRVMINAPA